MLNGSDQTAIGAGSPGAELSDEELVEVLTAGLDREGLRDARVLAIIPDRTRTFPHARVARLLAGVVDRRGCSLDYLVALGTHAPLAGKDLRNLVGLDSTSSVQRVENHRWDDPDALATIGELDAGEIAELSEGRLRLSVPIRINRMVLDYDRLLICGPVFPHEVVGFSGGNKYLFPGISGPELIDVSHWLGALLTSRAIIGRPGVTAVRRMIDLAASRVPISVNCAAFVSTPSAALEGVYVGSATGAWAGAAALAGQTHVARVPGAFERVLSIAPDRYPDIWTAAKAMYKLEPVVADGGELVIYAPHVRTFSVVHGEQLARVGYHVRDYFLQQWERFADVPWKILAHSTHVKGDGTCNSSDGEQPRIRVTLAPSIPKEIVEAHSLSYRRPDDPELKRWQVDHDPQTFIVLDAGEILYRLEGDRP
ncbi:MAG: lactate racemase domain-containing protein [Acidimicrobiales bacterium]